MSTIEKFTNISFTATQFVAIKNNKLITKNSLNHEMSSPGHEFKVAVQCEVVSESQSKFMSTKVFNISVIDVNDNFIRAQDAHINLTLNSPYFKKVRTNEKILFVECMFITLIALRIMPKFSVIIVDTNWGNP